MARSRLPPPSPPQKQISRAMIAAVLGIAALAAIVASRVGTDRAKEGTNLLGNAEGTGDVARDLQLANYVSSLSAHERRELAQALIRYEAGPQLVVSPPRHVIGSADAPVRVTYWIDVLGAGSAYIHAAARETHLLMGGAQVALEPRQFPRDAACNPTVGDRREESVRCIGARVLVCLQGNPAYLDVAARLLGEKPIGKAPGIVVGAGRPVQQQVSPERVFAEAATAMGREALERCVDDPTTTAKLRSDVQAALALGESAKPHVIVNGKQATPSAVLLRVLALTRGQTRHPAFRTLPIDD